MAFPDGQYAKDQDGNWVLICTSCGKVRTPGDWPACPHSRQIDGMLGKFQPYFDEHISERGEWITSLAQRKRLMRINKLDYKGKKVGMPRCMV